MVKNQILKILLFTFLLCVNSICFSQSRYFICGPDEDGCFIDQLQYCACIPYDEAHYDQPYCWDFNSMRCEPISNPSDCSSHVVFDDQSSCLATMYQSEPDPPCPTVSGEFCKVNHISTCDVSGNPSSCHR